MFISTHINKTLVYHKIAYFKIHYISFESCCFCVFSCVCAYLRILNFNVSDCNVVVNLDIYLIAMWL